MRCIAGVLVLVDISLPTYGADLLEVYRLAQSNDPTFDSARYTYEAAREKIPQARAGLLPVLNISGNDNTNRATTQFTNTPLVKRDVHAWTWTLQMTQPLFRAQSFFAYGEAESLVDAASAQYSQAEQNLILRVTQGYFDVLVAKESIDMADAQLSATNEQLALATHGFEAGANAITDVHEAKARADLARSQRIAAVNELEARRAELEKIVGKAPAVLAALGNTVVVPNPQPGDAQTWIEHARENNPAVLAPKAAFEAAQSAVNKNRSEHLPTLDLVASYGQNYSSGSLATPVDFATRATPRQIGVQLSLPLFAGGATNSRVNEAIAGMNKAAAELEVARRQAGTDARQAYSAIMNGMAQIEALESAVESSSSAVKGNQVGYQLGIHMNIDVLNAEQQFYAARRDLIKARYDTLFQGLKLKASAGVLTESDVLLVNTLLVH
jgi:outer membrane protein